MRLYAVKLEALSDVSANAEKLGQRRSYLSNVVLVHTACHIALVLQDEEGGSHETLQLC